MDEFGVSRNTAYRYLNKLEQFFQVYSPENGSKAFRLITNLNIDGTAESSDFAFIATLLDFAKRTLSDSYSKKAEEFRQRLFSSSRYQIYHYQTGEPLDYKIVAEKVATLEKYILTHTTIDIFYKKYDKRYLLNPYRILFSDGNWYLLADHNGVLKTLNLYHISDMKGAGKFSPRDEDINKYMNEVKSIWQNFEAESERVVVLIHKKMAEYFHQRRFF